MYQANNQAQLPSYRIRPRFKIRTAYSQEQLVDKLQVALEKENANCLGSVQTSGARLFLPLTLQHYWSPELSLTFEKSPEGTLLRGLYGPRATVWTMFVFFYAFVGLGIMITGMVGLSYLSLGKSSAILWWVPGLILVWLSLYLVAYFGQKLGAKQMVILKTFTEEALELKIDS